EESKNWDTTENIYIEGDNLEVLKLLQKSYYGKIKMIYIDPPYNTGKEFVYPDNYKDNLQNYLEMTGQISSEGAKLSTNTDTSGRYHTNWLNMMYPRLRLARNLLSDDGVIFISIDDNELANLTKMCNEVFGEENFCECIIWRKRSTPPNDKIIGAVHDYILIYAKSLPNVGLNLRPRTTEQLERYKNPDNHPKGPWTSGDLMANVKGGRYVESLYFPITNPNTGEDHYPSSNGNWRFNKATIQKLLENNEIYFGKDGKGRPKLKRFLADVKSGITYTTLWDFVPLNTQGSSEMAEIFGNLNVFDNPKPSGLIVELCRLGSNANSLILDFFSGSATTAHAIMNLNAEDNGNRKFIMVQLPEPTGGRGGTYKFKFKNICEIGKERINKSGDEILSKLEKNGKDTPDSGLSVPNLDIGFKVFKLDSSNLAKWNSEYDNLEQKLLDSVENIIPGRTELDLIYEIMLKYGINLTLPIEEYQLNNGKNIYSIGFGALMMCLNDNLDASIAIEIIKLKEKLSPEIMRVVFKDNGFKTDSDKTNIKETLKTHGIDEFVTI
ncbi:MAG: site-specific DNA-methyltransferase, partial [Candidatus Methanofastidiosa archaeon]|nr:site-specific DNA-methyltransferase [Candidatus Methanofastidiosa archaeon]